MGVQISSKFEHLQREIVQKATFFVEWDLFAILSFLEGEFHS
jgi:hypothetical protein